MCNFPGLWPCSTGATRCLAHVCLCALSNIAAEPPQQLSLMAGVQFERFARLTKTRHPVLTSNMAPRALLQSYTACYAEGHETNLQPLDAGLPQRPRLSSPPPC
ncbi:hypothetical protein J3F83DRAFT_136302 [Trichoderma novae-zelandiae]